MTHHHFQMERCRYRHWHGPAQHTASERKPATMSTSIPSVYNHHPINLIIQDCFPMSTRAQPKLTRQEIVHAKPKCTLLLLHSLTVLPDLSPGWKWKKYYSVASTRSPPAIACSKLGDGCRLPGAGAKNCKLTMAP